MNIRTVSDLNKAIVDNLHNVPRDIDAVVGVPRSGSLAASLLALHLNVALGDLNGKLYTTSGRVGDHAPREVEGRRVILVDDSVLTGRTMDAALARARAHYEDVIRLAIFRAPTTPVNKVDLWLEIVPQPRAFEWNLWKNVGLSKWAVDIDGALCRDPRPDEQDGEAYLNFLRSAEPLFLPSRDVMALVTCRLRKYEDVTRAWLAKHGVRYSTLVMLDLPSHEERRRWGQHARWKAHQALRLGATLFIESSNAQARKIAPILKRPVWSVEGRRVFLPRPLTP